MRANIGNASADVPTYGLARLLLDRGNKVSTACICVRMRSLENQTRRYWKRTKGATGHSKEWQWRPPQVLVHCSCCTTLGLNSTERRQHFTNHMKSSSSSSLLHSSTEPVLMTAPLEAAFSMASWISFSLSSLSLCLASSSSFFFLFSSSTSLFLRARS